MRCDAKTKNVRNENLTERELNETLDSDPVS